MKVNGTIKTKDFKEDPNGKWKKWAYELVEGGWYATFNEDNSKFETGDMVEMEVKVEGNYRNITAIKKIDTINPKLVVSMESVKDTDLKTKFFSSVDGKEVEEAVNKLRVTKAVRFTQFGCNADKVYWCFATYSD